VAAGGDLKSAEAVPIVLELADAFDELASGFGHDSETPLSKQTFIRPNLATVC
jgi:hypothetical protein